MNRLASSGALVISVALAACVGVIEDEDGSSGGSGGGPTVSPTGRDPGRVTLHRLNRAEYNNTVRDLFGTSLAPADDFPADDHGYGFDNIADVLSISPTQVDLYERAAENLVTEALKPPSAQSSVLRVEAETLTGSVGGATADGYSLWSAGDLSATFALPSDGTYDVRARVWGQQAGPEPVKAGMMVAGQDLGTFDVPNTSADPLVISKQVELSSGSKVVTVSFLNDYYSPPDDRNMYVDWIEVEGPIGATGATSAQRDKILICDVATGATCQRDVLRAFTDRAWRRPVTDAELDKLMGFVSLAQSQGEDAEAGIALALRAVLLSPNFIFRVELDLDPKSPTVRPLDDWELASRLSYFLWSSMPDDELFALARESKLTDPAVLAAQAQRMLADPKADALVDNFAGQWLYTRALVEHEPDYNYFPEWDDGLRSAMQTETSLFFQDFLKQGHPVDQLLLADFTFANDRLAQHYGISASGATHQKVTIGDPNRSGLLGQGSILTITSYPTRTSPVKRGQWVLSQLLCDRQPDPPPGVEGNLPMTPPAGTTLKELLAQHREKAECAVCHDRMDPIGIALENFDAVAKWRTDEGGVPIDPGGSLPGDIPVSGPVDLSNAIAADPRFSACVVKQLFTYALGRGPTDADDAYFVEMLEKLGPGYSLENAILEIVTSETFRMRRGEGGGS
jgi:hypothetical protein